MFSGVGDEPAPTIATAMAETSKTDATAKATSEQLQNAMQANKVEQGVSTATALKVQNAAGVMMIGWGLAAAIGLWWLYKK